MTLTPNAKQQQAIDIIDGPVMLLAGPGTGKTFTIIERIKKILARGVEPEKILCLTFTNAAANEMKKRIEEELNVISCDVQIFTYHSFCCSIIEEFPEDFEIPSNYKTMNDSIARAFICECISEIDPVYFRTDKNDPYYYVNKIKNRIDAIKQNRLTKEKFFKNLERNKDWMPEIKRLEEVIDDVEQGRNKRIKKPPYDKKESAIKKVEQAKELWKFYELYQQKMDNERYLDFNDMINLVLEKFESSPSFLHEIANRYEHILVDEYQDTNKSQNDIVIALSHALDTENIFVVGDDDQIIYRFQGAKLDTIENYLKEFPKTQIICLTENMRSTQSILDAARGIIDQDPLSLANSNKFKDKDGNPINKNLTAVNKEVIAKDKPVRFYKYADDMQELTEIVKEIEELINSDDCPRSSKTGEKLYSEIAVLTRSNVEAQAFGEMLKLRNIPFELKDGKDIFTIPAVNILYFYIQFLIEPELFSHRIFELLVSKPFAINPKDYCILYNEISKGSTFIEVLRNMDKSIVPDKLKDFLETYDYLTDYKAKENIKNTILEIGNKTGIFDYYLNTDINRTESIAGIKRFLDEAAGFSEVYKTSFLEEFYWHLKSIIEDDERICTDKAPVTLNAVQLCTYHGAKGREFEYVYMPTLETRKWESSSKSMKSDIPLDESEYKDDDELKNEIKPSDLTKLMYVAMTRAKHTLRMSYPAKIGESSKKPTKFLEKIQDQLEKEPEPFEYDEASYWQQINELIVKRDYDYKKDFNELIDAKMPERFSPKAINKYLNCPRQFLYEYILDLTTKDGNPNFASFGNAVHKACEKAIKYIQDNKTPPDKAQFIKWFKDDLENRPMESHDQRKNFIKRGEDKLSEYYCQIINTTPTSLIDQEKKLEYAMEDGTKFYGIIDRIDVNEDGTYTIYDYKTGNNKNSGIKIGGDHEDYYNQMAWYKYFYEKATGKKVSLTKFIYPEDFLSKNEGIKYSDEEIDAAVETFKQAVKGIKAHEFEPNSSDKNCKYCASRDFCGLNRF